MPSAQFTVKLLTMDASVTQSTLRLDEQVVQFGTDYVQERQLWWPGSGDRKVASIRLDPPSAVAAKNRLMADGEWAWFRLLDKARVVPRPGQPALFKVTFNVGGRRALYELRASRAHNPFGLEALRQFQCPERL